MSSAYHRPSSTAWSFAPTSGPSSSSSAGHGQQHTRTPSGQYPSPYNGSEGMNLAEAFAEVNRALGARTTRQSVAIAKPPAAAPPPQTRPTEPLRPRTLKKPQLSDGAPRINASRESEARRRPEVDHRFSTASAPTTYIRTPVTPWEHDSRSQERYWRASTSESIMAARRPDLRIVIPPARPARSAHRGQKDTFAGMGIRAAPSKDQSGCIAM
jgi:hypothetical protein